jgi:hypothetical protein
MNAPKPGERWRHKRSDRVYLVLHIGTLQTSAAPDLDDELCVVYQNETHYAIWVRPLDEFMDGRFERLS